MLVGAGDLARFALPKPAVAAEGQVGHDVSVVHHAVRRSLPTQAPEKKRKTVSDNIYVRSFTFLYKYIRQVAYLRWWFLKLAICRYERCTRETKKQIRQKCP